MEIGPQGVEKSMWKACRLHLLTLGSTMAMTCHALEQHATGKTQHATLRAACSMSNPTLRKNRVLGITVEIMDEPQCGHRFKIARFQYRSFQLTKLELVLENVRGLIRLEPKKLDDTLPQLEDSLCCMADFVNRNGGWTADGWSRQLPMLSNCIVIPDVVCMGVNGI